MRTPLKLGIATGCIALAFALGQLAVGQQVAPTENKGVSAKVIGALNLAGEIDGMSGRQLRMRVVNLEPGGVFAVHNHKDRPSVEFILKGTVTEFRGATGKEIKEGESVLADKDTTHWWRNDGTVTAVFVVADVFSAPK